MRRFQLWVLVGGAIGLIGCHGPGGRIELTSYDEFGQPIVHHAEFKRVFYRRLPSGRIEVVFKSERPSRIDPLQNITQVLYVRSFWNPQPGRSYVEATQINARVEYAMLTPPTGIRYDGGAFVTYKLKRDGRLAGKIESGTLSPRYRMGDAVDPFGELRIAGAFEAEENQANVVGQLHLIETQFTDAPVAR